MHFYIVMLHFNDIFSNAAYICMWKKVRMQLALAFRPSTGNMSETRMSGCLSNRT